MWRCGVEWRCGLQEGCDGSKQGDSGQRNKPAGLIS